MSLGQQREIEYGVYKQNVARKELMEEESSGLFACYTDPSRNISVGNTKSELSGAIRRQMALLEDTGSVDSDVSHRQAAHFLSKNNLDCALKCIEQARMGYLKEYEGEREVGEKFVSIVSTQAFCLLKLGDFITAKKFADQVLLRTASAEAQERII